MRIRTPRLLIRCWSEADAPLLIEAIAANLEYLRPWLPWVVHEPQPLDRKVALLRSFRRRFEAGEDFIYGLFTPDEKTVVGGAGLHRRIGAGAIEIGYWVHVDHVGQGLATEASAALARVGFGPMGLQRIEIHCEPANAASSAVAAKLGFVHEVTIPGCVTSPTMDPRDMMIWSMGRDDFKTSPAAAVEIEALDHEGLPLPL